MPHQQKSNILIMRNNWASFDYVSGREKSKMFDDIAVGGVVNNRLFNPPEFPRAMIKWQMRRVLSMDDTLKEMPYPDPNSTAQIEPI